MSWSRYFYVPGSQILFPLSLILFSFSAIMFPIIACSFIFGGDMVATNAQGQATPNQEHYR
jgi:hypothetical protein